MEIRVKDRTAETFDAALSPDDKVFFWCIDCEMPLLPKEMDIVKQEVRWWNVSGLRLYSTPICPVCKTDHWETITRQKYEEYKNRARLEALGLIIPEGVKAN